MEYKFVTDSGPEPAKRLRYSQEQESSTYQWPVAHEVSFLNFSVSFLDVQIIHSYFRKQSKWEMMLANGFHNPKNGLKCCLIASWN